MRRKNVQVLAFALCILTGCTACQNSNVESTQNTDTEISSVQGDTEEDESGIVQITVEEPAGDWELLEVPDTYQYESEHLMIDMEIEAPESVYFLKGTAEAVPFDGEAVGRYFMPEDEENTMEADENGGQIIGIIGEDGYRNKLFGWGTYAWDFNNTNSMAYIGSCLFAEKRDPAYNLECYSEKRTFAFATEEEALENVYRTLNEIGIDLGPNCHVDTYYLDHEIMQEQEQHYDVEGIDHPEEYKTDWSEADDTYLFYFHPTYSGLEDYHYSPAGYEKAENSQAPVTVFYGTEGISYIWVWDLYSYRATDKQEELVPFETVMDTLKKRFENVEDGSYFRVVDAQLCCTFGGDSADKVRDIIPVWAFWVEEDSADGWHSVYEIRVNALTGRIMT